MGKDKAPIKKNDLCAYFGITDTKQTKAKCEKAGKLHGCISSTVAKMGKYIDPQHPDFLVYIVLNTIQSRLEDVAETSSKDLNEIVAAHVKDFQNDLVWAQNCHKEASENMLEANDMVARMMYENFGELDDPFHYESIALITSVTGQYAKLGRKISDLLNYEAVEHEEAGRLKNFADVRINQLQAFDEWQKGGGYKSIEFAYKNLTKYKQRLCEEANLKPA